MKKKILILGAGNLGMAIAHGIRNNHLAEGKVMLIRGKGTFSKIEQRLFDCNEDIMTSCMRADIIILAVQPKQLEDLMKASAGHNNLANHPQVIVSLVGGASIEKIENLYLKETRGKESSEDFYKGLAIVRAMPNIGLKVGTSMTCLAFNENAKKYQDEIVELFNHLGKTLVIDEKMFPQATVLCGSGIAIASKFIRAFMQAGIQAGFNEHDSQLIATQVVKGAANLLQENGSHPELIVDKVTTPGGCTIDALAEMDHQGFTSAVLTSIKVGIAKARGL